MAMPEVFVLLFGLILLALWRELRHVKWAEPWFERHWQFAMCSHAVVILFMILFVMMCQDIVELVINNSKCDFLNPDVLHRRLVNKAIAQERIEQLSIPSWLRWMALVGPIIGLVAFLCLFCSLYRTYTHGMEILRKSIRGGEEVLLHRWQPSKRQDMVLLVLIMPGVYITMSVRSTQRMLMIMRGDATGHDEQVDLALFTENLRLASVCQYYIVFVFSQLCMEIQWAFKHAGFQGLYAWVICGAFRCFFDFGFAYAQSSLGQNAKDLREWTKMEVWSAEVTEKVSTMFTCLTLLCVYNMMVICNLKYITDALGKASLKFVGTRLLLLLDQVQLQVLSKVVDLQSKDQLHWLPNLSQDRANLLHSSLLSMECLVVVLFNWYAWERDVGGELYEHDSSSNVNDESVLKSLLQK